MKKILTVLICLLVGTLSLHAQKGVRPRKGGKAAGAGRMESEISRAVERDSHQKPKTREVLPQSRPGASSATRRTQGTGEAPSRISATTSHTTSRPSAHSPLAEESSTKKASSKTHQEEAPNPLGTKERTSVTRETNFVSSAGRFENLVTKKPNTPATISEAEAQLAELEAQNANLQAERQALIFNRDFGKSVLYAPLLATEELGYTVTVVKVGEEVFGVLPSHALPDANYANLSKQFYVRMTDASGNVHRLPAEVVQISPESMLDVSLVKFDKETEKLLVPLKLADKPAQLGEELYSYGYAAGIPTKITRSVNSQAFISLRTNQAIEGPREGFCGSPLLNANGEVVAFHTGTVEFKGDIPDVSFGTHASFIQKLVDAYHNNGTALYDLALDGHTIARLNVDEYVSAYRVFDANGKLLVQKNIEGKYSESQLRQAMQQHPQGKYLHITTRKAQWQFDPVFSNRLSEQTLDMLDNPTQVEVLRENRSKTDKTKRQHWYNIETQQIEETRPSIIKN